MKEIRVQVDQHGRFLFPSKIRKERNIKSGDVFIIRVIEDEIRMISLDKAVESAQNIIRQYIPENTSIVDELLSARQEDSLYETKHNLDGSNE